MAYATTNPAARRPSLRAKLGPVVLALAALAGLGTCDLFTVGLGSKVDVTAPEVRITSPAQGAYLGGTVTFTGTAADDVGVTGVRLVVSDQATGETLTTVSAELSGGAFTVAVDTSGFEDKRLLFTAVATDGSERSSSFDLVAVVDNHAPTVLVNSPTIYGAAGSPRVSNYIDVRGEAYDSGALSSVIVRALNASGAVLAQERSLNPASWSVSFDLAGAGADLTPADEEVVYYEAVATDAAGNSSTYYYHRSDLYGYLDDVTHFPSIAELATLDDASAGSVNGLEFAELASERLAPGGTLGDFTFDADARPAILFTNLNAGAPAGSNLLSLSSPITGLVTPPGAGTDSIKSDTIVIRYVKLSDSSLYLSLDGTDIDNVNGPIKITSLDPSISFVLDPNPPIPEGAYRLEMEIATQTGVASGVVSAEFTVDSQAPTLTETTLGNAVLFTRGDFTLGGTAEASAGLDRIEVDLAPEGSSFDAAVETTIPLSGTSSGWSWNSSDAANYPFADGAWQVRVRVVTSTDKSTELYRSVVIDSTAPDLELSGFGPLVSDTFANGVVEFSAAASDANGIAGVRYWILPASSPEPAWTDAATGSWAGTPYAASLDTSTLDDLDAYKLWIKARDKTDNALNESVVSRAFVVNQASDLPSIALTQPLKAEVDTPAEVNSTSNLFGANARLYGTLTDDDSIDAATVEVSFDSTDGVNGTWDSDPARLIVGADGASVAFEYDISARPQGVQYFRIRADDLASAKLGKPAVTKAFGPYYFAIDTANPALAVTTPNATGSVHGADFSIQGTASDANGLAGGVVVIKDEANATVASPAVAAGAWNWTVPVATVGEGVHDWTVVATDVFNKTTTVTVRFTVDLTDPVISITAPVTSVVGNPATWYQGASLTASGSIDESVASIEWSTDGATWTPMTVSEPWSVPVPLGALGEGSGKTFYLRATDLAGNVGSTSRGFGIDQTAPTTTSSAPASASAAFAITGTAGDSNALASIRIVQRFDGDAGSDTVAYDSALAGTSAAWSTGSILPIGGVASGTYEYFITITDLAGRTYATTNTVLIDLDAPESLSVTAPAVGRVDLNAISGTSFTVTGAASDAGVGLAKIWYLIDHNAVAAAGTAGYSQVAASDGPWSFALDLDVDAAGADTGLAEGTWYLHVKAEDAAGNRTADGAAVTVEFDHDQAAPSVTETALGTTSIVDDNDGFSLSGAASDGWGVASVAVYQIKDGGAKVLVSTNGPATSDGWATWSLASLPRNPVSIGTQQPLTSASDGIYEYEIVVTDLATKTPVNVLKRTVRFDKSAPELVVNAPLAAESSSSNLYDISGTARDLGAGFDGTLDVEYRLDGGSWTPLVLAGTAWSATDIDLGASQGGHLFEFRATDKLGNVTAVVARTLYYDLAPPSLDETLVGTEDTQYRNANLAFAGTASDSWSLASLTVKVDGGAAVPITVSAGSWTWTADVDTDGAGADTGLAEGAHTLVFTATDAATRTSTVTRRISVDTTRPTLSGVTDLSVGWKTLETQNVAGTAADAGSGVLKVEYRVNGGAWSYMNGVSTFDGSAIFASGTNLLDVRAVDRAGNESLYATQTVRVDTVNPEGSVTTPAGLAKANGLAAFAVAATATDAQSGVASLKVKIGSTDFASPDATGTLAAGTAANGTWTASIPAANILALAEGQKTVYVQLADAAGRTSALSFLLLVDKTPPALVVSSHAEGAVVNKAFTFAGTASDTQGLAGLAVEVWNQAGSVWEALAANGTYSWSADIDTSTLPQATYDSSVAAGFQLRLRAVATDEAGSATVVERNLLVDQDADRPMIRLSNVNPDGTTTLKLVTKVYGSVSDDDGAVAADKFWISQDAGATWSAVAVSGGNWEYSVTGADGAKTLYFKVEDPKGATFSTDAALSAGKPRVYVNDTTWIETGVSFSVDTVVPEIGATIQVDRTAPYDFADAVTFTTNLPFGGTSAVFAVRATATDANGIASVAVEVPGATGSPYAATLSGGWYATGPIDVSAVPDGSVVLTVKVDDNSGLQSTATRTLIVDNTAPELIHTFPRSLLDIVNGEIEVTGLASDGGSGLKSVQYKVGYNYAAETWTDVSGSLFSWEIPFTGLDKIDIYAVAGEATDVDLDGIWNLPIIMRAEDNAGNVFVEDVTDYVVYVDPSGDKPRAYVVYPDPVEPNRIMGGTIRIFGTAADDDGVGSVWMQIDVDGDGDYDAADVDSLGNDWYNGGNGRQVTGTASWNQTINASGEFNPPDDSTRTINFRVRARDVYGLDGAWTASNRIDVDKNVPQIGSTLPLQVEQGATVRTYLADMWLKGDWVFTGSVEDESGISAVAIAGDITGSLAANPAWFTPIANGYAFAIPVDTVAGSSGSIEFSIRASDNNTPVMETTANISLRYDNKNPTVGAYSGATPVVQSNMSYLISSGVTEDGAGFERVAVWFLRKGATSADDRVYNPMELKDADANRTYVEGKPLTMIDGLPRLVISGGTRPDAYSIQHAGLVDNTNIRKGGLIKIGGIDRLITNFQLDTGTVEWAEPLDVSVTDASLAYAIVVNNMLIESPAAATPYGATGYPSTITNDDGDGFVESVERSGGLYTWTASINSRNIPDGPVEIHWTAYDKAGNYASGSVVTSVQNNRPLLAAVTLGTDLTGDGDTLDPGETVPAYSALDGLGNEQAEATLDSAAFVARGLSSFDVDVVGGNGELFYRLTADTETGTELRALTALWSAPDSANLVKLSQAELEDAKIGEGAKTFVFKIWDSTEETTPGVDSQWAVLTVPMTVDVVDEVAPSATVSPFHWTSTLDNSLYQGQRTNGHIEIDSVTGGAGPDVSGKISVRGTAYDDQRLSALWLSIADSANADRFAFTGAAAVKRFFDTNGDTLVNASDRAYYRMATYDTASGTWLGTDRWATDGWAFTVTSDDIGQGGHAIEWRLDWDTSKVTGVAALDNLLRAVAEDKRLPVANASADSSTQTAGGALTPYYAMDVVPYITGIANPANQGLTTDVLRSSTGKYSVEFHASNVFNVAGFNLGSATVAPAARVSAAPISAPSGLAPATSFVSSTAATVSKNLTRSGYLTLFVNGVPSVNNLTTANDREWQQEYEVGKPYSWKWTDDRILWVWNVTQVMPLVTNQTFYYPDMMMDATDPTLPIFSYANDNDGYTYRTTSLAASVRRAGLYYERQTALAYADASWWILSVEDAFSGNPIGFLQLNRDVSEDAALGTAGTNFIELIGEDYTARQLNRFRYPKLIAETNGADADIYVSYYDAESSAKNITFMAMRATGANTTAAGFTQATGDNTRAAPVYVLPAAEAGAGFSQYYDMVKYGTNSVAIAYYDELMSVLRLAYSTAATTGNNVANTAAWSTVTLDGELYAGSHVSMTYDATNLYVAYYDSANANLKMVTVPIATMTPSAPIVVDAYLSVGTWTNIQIMDFDGAGTAYDPVPVITYYSDSFNGTRKPIKMAFPIGAANLGLHGVTAADEETFSGAWEVMTVPAASPPKGGMEQFNHTQIASYANNGMTLPVVGWLADRLEFAKLQPNN